MTGEEKDITKHFKSRCFRGFLHEYIVEELSLQIGMLTDDDILSKREVHDQHVLPTEGYCSLCGSKNENCRKFCQHPIMVLIVRCAREGKLSDVLD